MEFLIKNYGKFGVLLILVSSIVVFIQNTLGTDFIKDVVNHNLQYSYQLDVDSLSADATGENEAVLIVLAKNTGMRSLSRLRFAFTAMSPAVNSILPFQDSLFIEQPGYDKRFIAFLRKTYEYREQLFPQEIISLFFKVRLGRSVRRSLIPGQIIRVRASCKEAPGILVDQVSNDLGVNYNNLELILSGLQISMVQIMLRIVLPTIVVIFLIWFVMRVVPRMKWFKFRKN